MIERTGRTPLIGRDVRTIALLSLAFALFGTVVFALQTSSRILTENPVDVARGVSVVASVFWLIMFVTLFASHHVWQRQAAAVRSTYKITTTMDDRIFRNRIDVQNRWTESPMDLSSRCAEFLRDAIKAHDTSISPSGNVVTGKVRAFAFDYYPHRVEIAISAKGGHAYSIHVEAATPLTLGCPPGDGGGLAILVLFVEWLRGTPLPSSSWPHVMWKAVVAAAASHAGAATTCTRT